MKLECKDGNSRKRLFATGRVGLALLSTVLLLAARPAAALNWYVDVVNGSTNFSGLSPTVTGLMITNIFGSLVPNGPLADFGTFVNPGHPTYTLQPGDTIYVLPGVLDHTSDSYASCLNLELLHGTSNNPIIVTNYQNGVFTISNSGPANPTINIIGCSWVKVFGINSTNAYRSPILQYSSNCEVAYCHFGGGNTNLDIADPYLAPFTMYNFCQSNWIHNNVIGPSTPYNNANAQGVLQDGGIHGFTIGLFYPGQELDYTCYNIIESNIFFHSGHDLLSVYAPSNVVQYNWGHSAPWYAFTNIYTGSRDLELGGTIGNYNLVQYNNWDYSGYVPDEGCKGVEMSDGAFEIFRYNYCVNDGAEGIGIYGGKTGLQNYAAPLSPTNVISISNYIYNNTCAFDGFNLTYTYPGDVETNENNGGNAEYQYAMFFYSTSNNFVVNNLCYDNANNDSVFLNGFSTAITRWAGNMTNINPLFVNTNNTGGEFVETPPDCTLPFNSPAVDTGAWLAFIQSGSGSGTTFTVDNAGYFWGTPIHAGNRTFYGDVIQLQGQTNRATVTGISGNTITVNTSLSWTNGQGVALAYGGNGPDVGAFEYYAPGLQPPTGFHLVP